MATPTIDKILKGNLVMHDHPESDLGAILDPRYLKLDQTTPQTTVGTFTFPNVNVTGSLGVGTVAPATPFHVSGLKNTSILRLASTTNDSSWVADEDFIGAIEFYSHDVSNGGAGVVGSIKLMSDLSGTGNRTGMLFTTRGTASGVTNNALYIDEVGNIGINTTSPIYGKVQVEGGALGTTASFAFTVIDGTYNPRAFISHVTATNDQYITFSSAYSSGSGFADWCFTNGNVGINTTSPTAKLDIVAGNINLDNTTYDNQYGVISKAGSKFLHTFSYGSNGTVTPAGDNIFLGRDAGNYSMGGTATETYHSSNNIGVGANSLRATTTGYRNVGLGTYSFYSLNTGFNNFALGYAALYHLKGGYRNVAIGNDSGRYITGNDPNETSNTSIYIGDSTKAFANGDANEIVIGYNTTGLGSNTAVLGNSSITTTALRGNVGVGTPTVNARLHVYSAAVTDPNILFRLENAYRDVGFKQGTIGNAQIIQTYSISGGIDTGNLLLQPNAGNVGIGTTGPSGKLHIENATLSRVGLIVKTTDNNTTYNSFEVQSSSGLALMSISCEGAGTYNKNLTVNNGNNAVTNALSVKRKSIFDTGNADQVGVSIYGRAAQTADMFRIGADSSNEGNFLTVNASGNVGIGTTSPTNSTGGSGVVLQVTDTTTGNYPEVKVSGGGATGGAFFQQMNDVSSSLFMGTYGSASVLANLMGVARAGNSTIFSNVGQLIIGTSANQTLTLGTNNTARIAITGAGAMTFSGDTVFNEGGNASTDFRVETDNYDGLLVDASDDAIKVMNHASGKIGFYGGTAIVKQSFIAYTADNESGAYTGIDNAQAGTVYAQLTDINALRVAYENLRAAYEDLKTKLVATTLVATA